MVVHICYRSTLGDSGRRTQGQAQPRDSEKPYAEILTGLGNGSQGMDSGFNNEKTVFLFIHNKK